MPIRFNPSGTLNLGTDPADLPAETSGKMVTSGAMTRCTNLCLDRAGIASTRKGSAKLNSGSALAQTDIWRIVEQGGYRYIFAGTVIYKDEVSLAPGLTSAAWSTILGNSYNSSEQSIFALNGTDRKRITGATVAEWGSDSPTVAPTVAAGSLTGLTGAFNAKYTWCRKEDSAVVWESNPSPAGSGAITLANKSLKITWTAPTDSQITHVRIYRTSAGGSLYLWDQDIAIGTTTVDSDTADTDLGTEASWVNHGRPPLGTVVLGPNFNGYAFILKDNRLYYSLPNQQEYWPDTYYIEVSSPGFPCVAGGFLDGQLFVATAVEIFSISGTGQGTFTPLPMSAQTGTVNANCFVVVKGLGIYHLGGDGVYLYSGGTDLLMSRGSLDKIFQGETVGNVPGLNRTYINNCWMVAYHGKLYIGYPGGTSIYPDNVFVLDLQTKRFLGMSTEAQKISHHSYASTWRAVGIDHTNKRLLAADTSGYVWKWEDVDSTDDGGTAIAWQIQSADFNQLRKYFPRYARYDVKVGTGATAAGYILLDETSKQTHTIIGDRLTRKRLVDGCTGDRLAVRLSGSGSVDIFGVEIE